MREIPEITQRGVYGKLILQKNNGNKFQKNPLTF
jgi:hypothetical protein